MRMFRSHHVLVPFWGEEFLPQYLSFYLSFNHKQQGESWLCCHQLDGQVLRWSGKCTPCAINLSIQQKNTTQSNCTANQIALPQFSVICFLFNSKTSPGKTERLLFHLPPVPFCPQQLEQSLKQQKPSRLCLPHLSQSGFPPRVFINDSSNTPSPSINVWMYVMWLYLSPAQQNTKECKSLRSLDSKVWN